MYKFVALQGITEQHKEIVLSTLQYCDQNLLCLLQWYTSLRFTLQVTEMELDISILHYIFPNKNHMTPK